MRPKPRRKARMERTPLKPGQKPLKRKEPLKSGAPFARGGTLNRSALKRRAKPKQGVDKAAAQAWQRQTLRRARRKAASGGYEFVCPACGRTVPESRMEAHHVIGQEAIRKYVQGLRMEVEESLRLLVRLLWDRRNGLAVCSTCHDRHTRAQARLSRSLLDVKHEQFAREVGLERHLDRYYESSTDGGVTNG